MSLSNGKNGHKEVPELSAKQKETYKSEGKWPPPDGITVLVEDEPSKSAVLQLLSKLSQIVKPSQRKFVELAKEKLTEDT